METNNSNPGFGNVNNADVERLFNTLLSGAPNALISLVRTLVDTRDVTWLQALLDTGIAAQLGKHLPDPSRRTLIAFSKWEAHDPVDIFNILLRLETEDATSKTSELLDGWAKALGVSAEALQQKLPSISTDGLLRSYVARGSDPNAPPTADGTLSALTVAATGMRVSTTTAMLDILAERDEVPMHCVGEAWPYGPSTFFTALLDDTYGTSPRESLVKHLKSMHLPAKWKRLIAESIGSAADAENSTEVLIDPSFCQLLAMADFERPDDLAKTITLYGPALTRFLAADPLATAAPTILEALRDQKVDVDALPCGIYDGKYPRPGTQKGLCTMLHAAVYANNTAAVQTLLEAGADPYQTVAPDPRGPKVHESLHKNAFELASPTTRAVLDAWRARQAVQGVMASARRKRPTSGT